MLEPTNYETGQSCVLYMSNNRLTSSDFIWINTERDFSIILLKHIGQFSPDWPLANAESPVPHPLENGEVFTMH